MDKKQHENLKRAKIGPTILGAQRLLHGSGLNLWRTKIIITPCHVGATMDLDPTRHVAYDALVLQIYTRH
jgi:hypothetical protein